ncbi:MAG: hypothetical protein ACKOET_10535 [Verrucomicrobiota bacterium]
MKRILRRCWRPWVRLCWAGVWLPFAAAAAEVPVHVDPWYGHSAVLAPPFCNARGNVLLAGQVLTGCQPIQGDLVLPKRESRLKVDFNESRAKWRDFRLVYDPNSSGEDCEALASVRTLDTRLEFKCTGNKSRESLVVTNQTIGPVWVLYVQPEADRHQMPTLTEQARARVRVLSLTNGFDRHRGGSWVMASEAADGGDPLFCGLPRGFANRLARTESKRVIGLILVPSRSLSQKSGLFPLAYRSPRKAEQPDFQAGLLAAVEVIQDADPDGFQARSRAFREAERRQADEDASEGKVREPKPEPHRWTQISDSLLGQDIRVTGRVW